MNISFQSKFNGKTVKKSGPPEIIGSLPKILYRFYEDECIAQKFVNEGVVRLNTLEYLQSMEDAQRRDEAEGEGMLRIPGNVTHVSIDTGMVSTRKGYFERSSVIKNPLLIFCLCDQGVEQDYVKNKFGRYVVEIFDTAALVSDLKESLEGNLINDFIALEINCKKVKYDKGAVATEPPNNSDLYDLSFAQKPSCYEREMEYRIVVVLYPLKEFPLKFFTLTLKRLKSYARLLVG